MVTTFKEGENGGTRKGVAGGGETVAFPKGLGHHHCEVFIGANSVTERGE
jgi:hypothetical protein